MAGLKRVFLLLFFVLGCSPDIEFNGMYTGTGPLNVDVRGKEIFVKLILSQYGPEVGGLIKLYKDQTFTELFSDCGCVPVDEGQVNDGKLTFLGSFPGPCSEIDGLSKIKGIGFVKEKNFIKGRLVFTFCNNGEDCVDKAFDVQLMLSKKLDDLSMEDKKCP